MRNPDRIPETFAAVEQFWERLPDWRFGQLLEIVAAWEDQPSLNIEDDLLVKKID